MNAPPLDLRTPDTLVGVVHLPPLPGSPSFSGGLGSVLERALADADALASGGVDGIIVENFGDAPFFATDVPKETVSAMTRATRAVVERTRVPVGVNVLRNDATAALAVAMAAGASFVRINVHVGAKWTDQGLVLGRAADTLRYRQAIAPDVRILADVSVKHASPVTPRPIADEAEDCYRRGGADALIVTGRATGQALDDDRLDAVRARLPDAPIFAGSGVTEETIRQVLRVATGVIVGTSLKEGGDVSRPVDGDRVRRMAAARRESAS